MSPQPFHSFGPSHIAAMLLMFALAALLVMAARAAGSRAVDRAVRSVLVVLIATDWIGYLAMFYVNGWMTIGNVLPLNLCDWATIAVGITLVRPNQKSYDLAYFWALSGTLLTSITPDLAVDFPDVRFIFFFFYHAIIITSVLYLTFATGLRPVPGSLRRVILWTLAYGAVAGIADWLLGTNYGFLRAKPEVATLFDRMGAWPWYIFQSFAIGVAAMIILYLPFLVAGRLRARRLAA